MATLSAIRTAIKTTICTAIPSLSGYEKVPEAINVPGFLVAPSGTDFERAFGRGLDAPNFDVIVLVSRRDDGLAQDDLDAFVDGFGNNSIRQAIFQGRSLGIGVDAAVTGMSDYGSTFTLGGIDYIGARLTVQVLTSGTA
jgi:hypothetical protein